MAETTQEKLSMVVVMGVTGAGKSYFINQIAGGQTAEEGSSLESCTQFCQAVPVQIGSSKLLLIDTPGFDDAGRTDSEILSEIAHILSAQYKCGVELKGVIYVHRITDQRYTRSSVKTFEICQKVCGESALQNVLLVTSRWGDIADEHTGAARERELRDKFWAYMLAKGSTMSRFHGDRNSAVSLVGQVLGRSSITLDLQRELVDEGKKLDETVAGAYVDGNMEALKATYTGEIASLERLRRELAESDRVMRKQIQRDWEEQQERLARAHQQQAALAVPVARNVQRQVDKKRSHMRTFLPFVPFVLNILAMFVGIPPGAVGLITSWISDSGLEGFSFSDLLSS